LEEPRLKFVGEILFGGQTLGAGKKIAVEITAESEGGLARGFREASRFVMRRGLAGFPYSWNWSLRVPVKNCDSRKRRRERISISVKGG